MNCETYAEWMSARLDGELDAERARELDGHLAGCETCRKTRRAMEGLAGQLRGLTRYAPADRAVLAINTAVHRLAPAPRRSDFGPVMDIAELAEFLRVSPETVGSYLDELPSFELGGKLLFRRASVERWIEAREHRIQPMRQSDLMPAQAVWQN